MTEPKTTKPLTERGIRERSAGHYELRAYNAASGRQVTRTYRAPRTDWGAGIRRRARPPGPSARPWVPTQAPQGFLRLA